MRRFLAADRAAHVLLPNFACFDRGFLPVDAQRGGQFWSALSPIPVIGCRSMGGDDTLRWEPTHANADIDADARDSSLVPGFKLVSAQAFAVYRMDPHVVVFRASALGGCFVGFPSQGAGVDLYSRASRIRRVVLDPPGNGDLGVG